MKRLMSIYILSNKVVCRCIVLLALTGLHPAIYSQENQCNIDITTHPFNDYPLVSEIYYPKPYDSQVVFLMPWSKGEIYFEDGHVIKDILLRYDRFDDVLTWMRGNDFKAGTVTKDLVKGFVIVDKNTQQVFRFEKRANIRPGYAQTYAQVLAKGFMTVYVVHYVDKTNQVNDFNAGKRHYVYLNNDYSAFNLGKSRFLSATGEYKKEMRAIIRQNKLSLYHNQTDLIRAVELFNEVHQNQ